LFPFGRRVVKGVITSISYPSRINSWHNRRAWSVKPPFSGQNSRITSRIFKLSNGVLSHLEIRYRIFAFQLFQAKVFSFFGHKEYLATGKFAENRNFFDNWC
jgi:hypothetical protein